MGRPGRNISTLSRASHLHLIMGNFCGRSIRQAADLTLCQLAEMSYLKTVDRGWCKPLALWGTVELAAGFS